MIFLSKRRAVFLSVAVLAGTSFSAHGATAMANQNLTVTVNAAWSLLSPGIASLTHGQTAFQPYQATVPIRYEARTTAMGSGKITLQVTSDFSPAGGPSVSKGELTYTCDSATLGAPCTGPQMPSTSIQTPVLTLPASACTGGGGPCSGPDPNSVNLTFTLIDDPGYATGTYSANVTFTISAI